MTPELEKFIGLATRPLGERSELREEARGELMARLGQRGVPVEMIDVSAPTERLESARRLPDGWRRGLVLGALLLLFLVFLVGVWRDGSMLARSIYASDLSWRVGADGVVPTTRFEFFFYNWLDRRAPELPISGRKGEVEALRRDHPEDLAILQETLVGRSIGEDHFMTDAERALIQRIDPDNALWPLLEMNWEFHKAFGEEPFSRVYYGSSSRPDPDAAVRGWERYAEAVELDEFRSYGRDFARRQSEALGKDRSVLEGLLNAELATMPKVTRNQMNYYLGGGSQEIFGDSVNQKILDLKTHEKRQELRELFASWRKLHLLQLAAEYPDGWVLQSFNRDLAVVVDGFVDAFSDLGMEDERKVARAIAHRLGPGPTYTYSSDAEQGMRLQAGSWRSVDVTPEEMWPGRKADMAMFHRMLSWPLALIALIFVLMWGFEACRRSSPVKGIARGLMPLLGRHDHLLIVLLGIFLPWAYWWVITRLTPLGISDKVFGDDEWVAMGWVLQMAIGMTLGLVALTHVVQWRWAKAGGFLGLAGHVTWLGWVVIGLAALSLPACGLIRFLPLSGDEEKGFFLLGCAATGSIGLLWLLWIGIMNLCTSREGSLRPNVVARTMIPWSLVGFASLLLAIGCLRLAEGWWYARDPLLPGGTSEHYANALEEREVLEEVHRLREALGE